MYKVVFTKRALKNLKKIDSINQKKIMTAINELSLDPFKKTNVKKLKGHFNLYRVRVGNYRAIYSIKENIITLEILDINHRKNIY